MGRSLGQQQIAYRWTQSIANPSISGFPTPLPFGGLQGVTPTRFARIGKIAANWESSILFDRYASLQWTTAQKQELSNYQEGQVLQFHRDTKLAKRHESLEVVRVGPESLVARRETGEEVNISPKQTRAFSVYEHQPIEVALGDSLMLTANRRGPELRATNGELVKVELAAA
jgi:hypothetical protein